MNAPAAIKATFADFKLIKGRKCAQLVFEVPLEAADAALATLGGLPRPDAERWFAIARLDLSKTATAAPSEPEKVRKPFETLQAPQQAALRSNDPNFQRFIRAVDADDAADLIRNHCGIKSRAELATNDNAAKAWRALDDEFFKWQRGFR